MTQPRQLCPALLPRIGGFLPSPLSTPITLAPISAPKLCWSEFTKRWSLMRGESCTANTKGGEGCLSLFIVINGFTNTAACP